jgi:vacuolar-type H+-ATPase subunit I/STV1
LRLEQNLPLGFAGGTAAAIVGAIVWAIITVATGYQIGWIAMGVGFIVGYSVRYLGKGMDPIFGIMGGALALFGCLLGNFFSLIGITANQEGMPYLDLLSNIDYSLIPEIMIDTFSPMDLLFYGIAAYEGYKFSFRQITEQEIAANAMK